MELTDEQISKLSPEQITELEKIEDDPEAVAKYLADQEKGDTETETDEPEQEEEESAAHGAGQEQDEEEEQPVVLTKNGKGTIPYEKHKALRVENATLKEQLDALKQSQAELAKLKEQQARAKTPDRWNELQEKVKAHIAKTREDFPEVGDSLDAFEQLIALQRSQIEADREERKAEKEAAKAKAEAEAEAQKNSIDEQVQEAKDNNPDLVHWENEDGEEWKEALRQDQALLLNPKWQKKSYSERFVEVVKRVRAIMPEASEPPNTASAKTKESVKAKLEKAPTRKPTTLSDIQGGGEPLSEKERIENLSPHELAQKLMKMPASAASAMRADLD